MENDTKKVWPRTIAPELHEAWKTLKRKKDADTIAKELHLSRPVIDRALNFGYVSIPSLVDSINEYFEKRKQKEVQNAAHLLKK